MNKKSLLCCAGLALVVFSGMAQAQCEGLRVIVRNSVYPIIGLDAFCSDFNKVKADLADMRSELSIARQENAQLRTRLMATPDHVDDKNLAHRQLSRQPTPMMKAAGAGESFETQLRQAAAIAPMASFQIPVV